MFTIYFLPIWTPCSSCSLNGTSHLAEVVKVVYIFPGFFIRHRNRRLQVTQIRSQGDKNDASFLMTDAYTGGATSVITETEQAS